MIVSGLIKQSLIDYPGEIAAVIFTSGCNLRCPFCHNPHLLNKVRDGAMDIEHIFEFLRERTGFLDGVVITGGEPTLHNDLPEIIERIKAINYKIKLDTNGSNSEMLQKLLENNLLDSVAMDIKAPLCFKKYLQACGKISRQEFLRVRNSMILLKKVPIKVTFRTTVVPVLHSPEDIVDIAKSIAGSYTYNIQQYNPECVLNPSFKNIVPYSSAQLREIAESCRQYVKEVKLINLDN